MRKTLIGIDSVESVKSIITFQLHQPALVSILVSASLILGIMSHNWAQNLVMYRLEDAHMEKPLYLCPLFWISHQQEPQYLHP